MSNYKTKTITNNHHRYFRYRCEVPQSVLSNELDWTDEDTIDGYIRYKGYWYQLGQFMRSPEGSDWHGYHSDSAWSGVAIRLSDDGETYQIATLLSVSA